MTEDLLAQGLFRNSLLEESPIELGYCLSTEINGYQRKFLS
jgi:hypothetical protein